MGEVRVKVKLTNVVDQAAPAAGKISTDSVRTVEADAMVVSECNRRTTALWNMQTGRRKP